MIAVAVKKRLFASTGSMHLDVDFRIETGDLITLYGPSGAGKTTILRMLCGLAAPDEGRIVVNGKTWYDSVSKINVKPQVRNVGMVFQDYALFPNMTVKENLEYALKKDQSATMVEELLDLTELSSLANKKPVVLSGGQQQRVALARAIVRRPALLLLDEPMSALDTDLRFKIQDYILKAHRQYNLTTILVSHDIIEIVRLSQTVYHLENGLIVNQGHPTKVLPIRALRNVMESLPDTE